MIPNRLLQLLRSLHDDDTLSSFAAGMGKALAERKWTRKRRSIVG